MRFSNVATLVVATSALGMIANSSSAAITGLQRVASGLSAPIYMTHAPGDRERLFIVQRGGGIRILNLASGSLETTPFLSIPDVNAQGEGGLLGMAFHPGYSNPESPGFGKFYVNVTVNNPTPEVFEGANSPFSTLIREYTVSSNPNVANTTPNTIMKIVQPQDNHNGGWIDFSPVNGYLYIPTGDGGGGGDSGAGHTSGTGNAQDITNNPLGKILRIDVDGDDFPADANRDYRIIDSNPYADMRNAEREVTSVVTGDDEIWATGLRNPFRDSFDRLTGDLWLGDVGQGSREEIDRQPANAPAGENFGWRLCEGNLCASPPANYRGPVYDYNRNADPMGGSVVTGGYVYRGPDPSLQGKYFFLDSRNSSSAADDNYWHFDINNPTGTVQNIDSLMVPNTGTINFPVSFGEDAVGNLYIAYISSGNVFRIATNELIDGDYNADGAVDDSDFAVWQANFGATAGLGLAADGNNDNEVNAADFTVWRDNFGNSAQAPGAGGGGVAVPEPTALVVVATAFGSTLLCRRQRKNLQ